MFTTQDLAFALDTEPPALRYWLRQPEAKLQLGYGGQGRPAEFTFHDVAVLALVREMITFGLDAEASWRFAHHSVTTLAGWSENQAREAYWQAWGDHVLFLRREKVGWTLIDFSTGMADAFANGLIIKPAGLIERAIERAEESAARREERRRA